MPVEYPSTGGLVAEHKAVRVGVGVFDVSHMGDIRISANGSRGAALAAVEHITMNQVSLLAVNQAQYSAMLYPQGTFVDDILVHKFSDNDYLLVINAGTREKDYQWIRSQVGSFAGVHISDYSDHYTQLRRLRCAIYANVEKCSRAIFLEEAVRWFEQRALPSGNHLGNGRLKSERTTEIEGIVIEVVIAG